MTAPLFIKIKKIGVSPLLQLQLIATLLPSNTNEYIYKTLEGVLTSPNALNLEKDKNHSFGEKLSVSKNFFDFEIPKANLNPHWLVMIVNKV